jgi:hypothetical protein
MVTICLYNQSSGKPVPSKKVHMDFGGEFFGSFLDKYTDSRGEANFEISPRTGKVSVDNKERYKGYLNGKITVYV